MRLEPPAIAAAYQNGDVTAMDKLDVLTCIECGCCSYSCPAHRYIVQVMRMAKSTVNRARQEAKKV